MVTEQGDDDRVGGMMTDRGRDDKIEGWCTMTELVDDDIGNEHKVTEMETGSS